MRDLFQKKEIHERMKECFEKFGYTYIPNLYWDEFVGFLFDENNAFSDILSLLNEDYHIEEEDALKIVDELFTVLYPYRSQLKGFFGGGLDIQSGKTGKRDGEIERRTSVKSEAGHVGVESQKSITSVKQDAGTKPHIHPLLRKGRTSSAAFYFSPEDEEEIRKAAYGVSGSTYHAKEEMDAVYDKVAEEVITKTGIMNHESGIAGKEKS